MQSPNLKSQISNHSAFSNRQSQILVAALVAALLAFYFLLLPPGPRPIHTAGWEALAARTIPGAYHVHTTRSDGAGDKHDVAAAAKRAGLRFVILTDHGDGTRPPDPPEYIDGVLCLDAVEISSQDGHYVAIGMSRAPYPLGGAGDAVQEDVARLGGFGVVAHPDSPKPALRWRDGFDRAGGIEWLNADSEWRKDSRARLARAVAAYFFRPGPALVTLFDRPPTLDRWDRLTVGHPLVGLAAADAHGGMQSRPEPERGGHGIRGIPSYAASFSAFSNRVVLSGPLSGDPARDAREIYDAIRQGRVFSSIDALAAPALLDFHAEGDSLVARTPLPAGGELVLLHGGQEVVRSATGELRFSAAQGSGSYRVEGRMTRRTDPLPLPWLVSSPIYMGAPGAGSAPVAEVVRVEGATEADIAPFPWRIEKDPLSSAILRSSAHAVELQYTLGGGARNNQFVALATDLQPSPLQNFETIHLGLVSERPMRLSVQLRRGDGRRWALSVYVDSSPAAISLPVSALRPIGQGSPQSVDAREASSLLLVIDLTNAVPGHAGDLRILSSALVK
jgi:hypothetical protein